MRSLAGLLLFFWSFSASAQTPTPEIPNASLNDIAMVQQHPGSPTGAVIVYNPHLCNQIGLACVFFKFHEHGHVALGHPFTMGVHPAALERDADRFAATHAPPPAIFTAWQLFMNGGSSANFVVYGTPYQRAHRLCVFSQQAGTWIGPSPCP
ncbi:hypothetical protein [Amorphus orientalis]|uniref:Uncharacterized protein n=1 Tax=Amorphus orientalis TaxID=649198 RepID=A0AAE3VT92_9HYPH|nr:hypothetical protein [Amorphus orientalis]MDQ0317797.1 hypothetical protein [Amorphus orientalis]